jgi:hypothetical protein
VRHPDQLYDELLDAPRVAIDTTDTAPFGSSGAREAGDY